MNSGTKTNKINGIEIQRRYGKTEDGVENWFNSGKK